MLWTHHRDRSSPELPNDGRAEASAEGAAEQRRDRVRIVDVAAGDRPSFTARRGMHRFVIALDGSAAMKLCGSDSYEHWSGDLAPQLGRVAATAERLLRARKGGGTPACLTVSALDLD